MKGQSVETLHIVNALPPVSTANGKTSDYWSMKNYEHATILLTFGAAVQVDTFLVYQSEDAAGAGEEAIPFKYYAELDAAGDVLDRVADATAAGIAAAATANVMYAIEIDAAELAAGHSWMCVKLTGAAGAQLGAVIVILSGARYQGSPTATAIV